VHRYRSVAATPVRAASESWQVIGQLVQDTLERSEHISATDVGDAMQIAAQAGRMLIAAGHLESAPLILIAGDLHLEITTVSGDQAFSLEENLNPVPGGATATEWTVHLPSDGPLGTAVRDVVASSEHLSADKPKVASAKSSLTETDALVDKDALRGWASRE
jgi:hypothetical protein